MSSIRKADGDETDLQSLQQALLALQMRVETLEALKPTITTVMPNFSERFHVMHRAGEAGDWAVAGHELLEMKRLTALASYIDAEKGVLMQGMMGPSFEALEEAVEHGNQEKFHTALEGAVTICNACHTATGSPFIQVTLDATDAISLRHPHALTKSEMAGGHSHGEPAIMQKGMESMTGGESGEHKHQDEAGDHKHED